MDAGSAAPRDLPHEERFAAVLGSFDETFLVSTACTNGSETFETNYTYFSGAEGTGSVSCQLVPVKNVQGDDETSFSPGVLTATIEPDHFTAEPYHIYISRIRITVGPNITGIRGPNFAQNPVFPIFLKVQRNGRADPEANDWVQVVKVCNFMPGMGGLMRSDPLFNLGIKDNISVKAGETVAVPLTIDNHGGGIREEYFTIDGMLNTRSYSFPFTKEELSPIPPGIQFTVDPPQVIGRSFRTYNLTLAIATTKDVSPGTYDFPIGLCYRDLAVPGDTSDQYPFGNRSYCNTGTDFTVVVSP